MPNNGGNNVNRPTHPRRPRSPLIAIAVTLLLAVGAASAGAASSIEGIWSFNGGQIAIQPSSNGKFTGIVVVETKFAECAHPVEQPIWTEVTPQPDGSYWGLHQWYYESPSCPLNPTLGQAAWRVLEESNGSKYLLVCLSSPGSNSQPTIATNGSGAGTTYGCVKSELTAPLPTVSGKAGVAGSKEKLTLPNAKKCLSVRLFKIHLADPKYDPLKKVTVTLKGRKIETSRKGNYVVATIDLKGLPKGTFTVKVRATTVLGHHLSASRKYHTCVKKIKQSGKKKSHKKG
jgi:hypothetical protein